MKTRFLNWKKRKNTSKINPPALPSRILILTFTILLSACGGQDARSTPDYFIPPTVAPRPATATPSASPTPDQASTAEPFCQNDLRYIEDITIPDNTVVAPGQEIEKIWLVQNSGTCNWEIDYTLRNTNGPPMGSSSILALYPVRSGGEYEIAITFTAPTDEGQHITRWQAHDPEGVPFGQEIYMIIEVDPDLVPPEE